MVLFYSNSCYHCHTIKDDWSRLVDNTNKLNIKCISIEQSFFGHLPNGFFNDFYYIPTLVIVTKKGKLMSKYEGPLSLNLLEEWVRGTIKREPRKKKERTEKKGNYFN